MNLPKLVILSLVVFISHLSYSQSSGENDPHYYIKPGEILINFNVHQVNCDKNDIPYYYKNGINISGSLILAEKSTKTTVIGKKLTDEQLKKMLVLKKNKKVIPVKITFSNYKSKIRSEIKFINDYAFMIPIKNLTEGEYSIVLSPDLKNQPVRYDLAMNGKDNLRSFKIKTAKHPFEKEEMLMDIAENKEDGEQEKYISELLSNKKILIPQHINNLQNMMFELKLKEKKQIEAMAWLLSSFRIEHGKDELTEKQINWINYHIPRIITNRFRWEQLLKNQKEIDKKAKDIFQKYFSDLKCRYHQDLFNLKTLYEKKKEMDSW